LDYQRLKRSLKFLHAVMDSGHVCPGLPGLIEVDYKLRGGQNGSLGLNESRPSL
jgi:hypothetical protein